MTRFNQTMAFIGAGHIAGAIMGGLLANQCSPERIWAANPTDEKLGQLRSRWGIQTTQDNREAASKADVIIVTVRPTVVKTVMTELADIIQSRRPLVISVASGIQITQITQWTGIDTGTVRCMPNVAAMVGSSATGLCASVNATEQQRELAESIMRAVGATVWVSEESQLDIVTALSGSGPGYFYLIMEAMVDAGIALGLEPSMAELLTIQTALGSAKLALESQLDLAQLRASVTVPGGTTQAAIQLFENQQLSRILAEGIRAAAARARELGKG